MFGLHDDRLRQEKGGLILRMKPVVCIEPSDGRFKKRPRFAILSTVSEQEGIARADQGYSNSFAMREKNMFGYQDP
jgi:hypothetical protein